MKPLLLVLLVAGCVDNGPHLDSAEPPYAYWPHETNVLITGERMCGSDCATAAGEFTLEYGSPPSVQLPVVTFADTSAMVTIPGNALIGKASIVLTVNDHASNGVAFEIKRPASTVTGAP